jgi:hypothetical protein
MDGIKPSHNRLDFWYYPAMNRITLGIVLGVAAGVLTSY